MKGTCGCCGELKPLRPYCGELWCDDCIRLDGYELHVDVSQFDPWWDEDDERKHDGKIYACYRDPDTGRTDSEVEEYQVRLEANFELRVRGEDEFQVAKLRRVKSDRPGWSAWEVEAWV